MLTEPRFDMYAVPPPDGDWAYEVDYTGVTYGPGWWPFYRDGRADVVRLAPNTRYWAWRNEYVLLGPGTGATVSARVTLYLAPQGLGGLVVDTQVRLDLRARTATVDPGCPAEVCEQAQIKADRLVAAVLAARAERRRGRTGPTTAYDPWIARNDIATNDTTGKEEP
jgi:hypothetical protein